MTFIVNANVNSGDDTVRKDPLNSKNNYNRFSNDAKQNENNISGTTSREDVKVNGRKNGVSIDVTKALVLLGFDSWSSLEPDKSKYIPTFALPKRSTDKTRTSKSTLEDKKMRKDSDEQNHARLQIKITSKTSDFDKENQFKLVEEKLANVLESRIRERREYLELIKQTKNMNLSLYNNMMKADTERADALFVNGCKAQNGMIQKQDEEEIALKWAYDTIKNEYLRRMEIRSHLEKDKKVKSTKRNSRWASKKLEAEKLKRKVESGKLILKPKPSNKQEEKKSSINEIICESKEIKAKRSLELLINKEENSVTKNDSEEKNLEKNHVEIIRIQDTMKHKVTPMIYTTSILKTDEEREAAARKLLCHLQQQKRERKDEKALNGKPKGDVYHQSMDMNFDETRYVPKKSNQTNKEIQATKVEDIIVHRPERSKADSNRFQEGNQKSEANDMMREIINESSLKTINSPMVKRIPPRVSNKIKKLQANEIANSKHRRAVSAKIPSRRKRESEHSWRRSASTK